MSVSRETPAKLNALLLESWGAQRDFGQGLIAPRPGNPNGRLSSPFGLALRSNQSQLITWLVASLGLGLLFGYFAGSIKDMLSENPAIAQVFASGQADPHEMTAAIAVTILSLAGIILSISGVQIMLSLRAEEQADRLEPAIVAGGSRTRHYLSYVALALLSTAVFLALSGALMGIVAQVRDVGLSFSDVFLQSLCAIPAVWAVIGVSVAVVGARPAVSIAAWAGVFLSFALTLLGPTFKLWNWALAISPFYHVPNINALSTHWVGICVVLFIALLLCAIGLRGFVSRDLSR